MNEFPWYHDLNHFYSTYFCYLQDTSFAGPHPQRDSDGIEMLGMQLSLVLELETEKCIKTMDP